MNSDDDLENPEIVRTRSVYMTKELIESQDFENIPTDGVKITFEDVSYEVTIKYDRK